MTEKGRSFEDIIRSMNEGWAPPIAKLIGMEMISFGDGRAEFKMEAGKKHHNPMGTLHGGVMADIMDATMSMAFASTLGSGETMTTVNLQINFIKQVLEGRLISKATVIKRGRSIGFMEGKLFDEEENLVATAQSTCKVLQTGNN